MSRDFKVYLDDILDAVTKIETYIQGYDYQRFAADDRTVDAVNSLGHCDHKALGSSQRMSDPFGRVNLKSAVGC